MTTTAIPRPRSVFKGFMKFLKVPAIIGTILLAVYLIILAFRVTMVIELEAGGGFMPFMIVLGGLFGGVFTVTVFIGLLIEESEHVWLPPAAYAAFLWVFVGSFFLVAGTTFPLPAGQTWVTRNGNVYVAGDEVPRGFLRRNGTPITATQEMTREVAWSDVAQNLNQEMNFTTTVTIVSTIDTRSEALEARLRELFQQNESLANINSRLWEAHTPPVLQNPAILEQALAEQAVTIGTVFENNTPWIASVQATAVEHRVSLIGSKTERVASAQPATP